jgi:hypothetical protein
MKRQRREIREQGRRASPRAKAQDVGAPTARDKKARGKREARRPWLRKKPPDSGLKGRNNTGYFALSGLDMFLLLLPGATRFALAPGFHISRRWRSGISPLALCGRFDT